jgi:hypothetical protein
VVANSSISYPANLSLKATGSLFKLKPKISVTTGNKNFDHEGAQRYTKEWISAPCPLELRAL